MGNMMMMSMLCAAAVVRCRQQAEFALLPVEIAAHLAAVAY
jgi:hypothetical protein